MALRNSGTIKQAHINGPSQDDPTTSDAKVVFFTHAAAQIIHDKGQLRRLYVGGKRARVAWNRVKISEEPVDGRSRSLRIRGPIWLVNTANLEAFWTSSGIWWGVDEVRGIGPVSDTESVVWYSFASWRCPADFAKKALEEKFGEKVTVTYRADPCA